MKLKRIARASIPFFVAILISWPFGFPVGVWLLGAILFYITYEYWEPGVQTGEKLYHRVQELRLGTKITEEKLPSPPRPNHPGSQRTETVGHNAPTVPITGHFKPMDEPEEDAPEPDFIIGTTEPSRPGAGDNRVICLDKITSMGVGGVPGSGKTVAIVGLCTQAVPKYKGNVRFLVIDPHMHSGSKDALSARMSPLSPFYLNVANLPNPVSGGSDLLKWVEWLTKQAKDRIGGRAEQTLKLVVVADEFTALMDDDSINGPLTELLVMINEQARKVGMFALVASPAWKSSRVQGTDVRNTIASFLVHNMPPNIARQVIPNSAAELANTLEVGQAIFSSFGKIEVVRVPYMTHRDITRCVQPYLPPVSGITLAYDTADPKTEIVPADTADPGIAEVKAIWETYMILNRDLSYEEANAIRALAIDFYPGDPAGQEKVRKALRLGEEHL